MRLAERRDSAAPLWSSYERSAHASSTGMRLAAVLGALSHALDLTEGQPQGHCMRAAWIGHHIGVAYGLTGRDLDELYFTILLKDLGCSSNAARICELYLADDIAFKHDFKLIDGSLSSALRFVMAQTGLKAGLSERFRAIVNIVQNGGEISRELIETRCHRGADIAAKMGFSNSVQNGILSLDEHWDGGGKAQGLAGEAIPVVSRIALLSQVVDIFHAERGPEAAVAEARNRAGGWFDPSLVEALVRAQADPAFWTALSADAIGPALASIAPRTDIAARDDDTLDEIAEGFADVVDAKSPFTSGHCQRVTLFADMIGEEMGLDETHRRWLRRSALLHDIGKLGVSNDILDKPGKPDEREWAAIRMHPVHGRDILAQVPIFQSVAHIAGQHHEKLNGRGYPDGLDAEALCLETRIVSVADVFDALSAERPYRGAMPIPKALAIMDEDVGTSFDPECLAALKGALQRADFLGDG